MFLAKRECLSLKAEYREDRRKRRGIKLNFLEESQGDTSRPVAALRTRVYNFPVRTDEDADKSH